MAKTQEEEINRLSQALIDIIEDAEWRMENTESENYDLLMSIASTAKTALANVVPKPNKNMDRAFVIFREDAGGTSMSSSPSSELVKTIVKVVWTEERAKLETERLSKADKDEDCAYGYEPVKVERRAIADGVRMAKG